MCVYIYIYQECHTHIHPHTCIYIYVNIKREREILDQVFPRSACTFFRIKKNMILAVATLNLHSGT